MKRFTALVFFATIALAAPAFALQQAVEAAPDAHDDGPRFYTCYGPFDDEPRAFWPHEPYEPPKTIEYAAFDHVVSLQTSFLPEVQRGGQELQFD